MRMSGYPAKVKSLSWSSKGKWLASSGAQAAIVWPFQAKDGPMGKAPVELGTRGNTMVTAGNTKTRREERQGGRKGGRRRSENLLRIDGIGR